MKKTLSIFMLIFCGTSFAQDFWAIRDSVNGPPRSVATSFVLGDDGYIVGGLDFEGFKRKMYSYDPDQNDWDDELSLGGINGSGLNRGSATSFVVSNRAYVTLGQGDSNPFFNDTWEYNPETESWSQRANFIGESRRQAVSFVLGDTAYVGTGYGNSGLLKDFFKYVPSTNTWEQLNDFQGSARKEACSFVIGNNGFICTGDAGTYMNDLWKYFPESDTWIQKADFIGTPRKGAASWSNGTKGFVATGEDNQFNYTQDVYEFNPIMNSWIQRADFIGPGRTNAIAFFLNGLAYLGTGYNGELLDDFYGYQEVLGIEELNSSYQIQVFPNPMVSSVQITSSFEIKKIEMIDLKAQIVSDNVDIKLQGKSAVLENVGLTSGVYFIQIWGDDQDQLFTKRLLVK